jgi:predicted nucleotidyltransferase
MEKLNKKQIIKILKAHGIKKAGIFGSYARGEQTKNSDVDILIELPRPMGFDFVQISFDLEKGIKRKVDLVTYNSLHPLLKKSILLEEKRII